MLIINILVVLLLVYLFFLFFPALFMFISVFSRKKGIRITENNIKHTYYAPFADRFLADKEFLLNLPKEKLQIKAYDGVVLAGEYFDHHSDKTILLFHGYKAHYIDQFPTLGRLLYEEGYNLLFTCQRAHGESGGKFATMGIREKEDVCSWVDELKRRGKERIVICGMSLGSTAVALASNKLDNEVIKGLVLDCGYCSPYEQMCTDIKKWGIPHFVIFPLFHIFAKLFLNINLKESVRDSVKGVQIPALIMHGMEDRSVAFHFGEEIYECFSGEKEKLFVPGADHTVSLLAGGTEAEEKVKNFIKKYI